MPTSNKVKPEAPRQFPRRLRGADGRDHSLHASAGETATVVVFTSNGCPTARAYEQRLIALQEKWRDKGVRLIAVNSNNASLSPPDTLEEMTRRASRGTFNFPYLKDEDGSLASDLGAICTPHAFVLDRELRVAYSGRIDDSRLGDRITSNDLDNAISDLVANRPVSVNRTEPFGCSIVWS